MDKLLHAPMRFFDTTPIGRLINRLSKDMYAIDHTLPGTWQSYQRLLIILFLTLMSVCVVTPWFAIIILPLGFFYSRILRYFIATARELKRISSLLSSPIYSGFSEMISGTDVIRAFNKESSFSRKLRDLIDADHQAYYPSMAVNRWLGMRLEMTGNLIIGVSAFFCVFSQPSPGFIGVALSAVMSVTSGMNWLVRTKAQLEQDIVSVERTEQYNSIEQEAPFFIGKREEQELEKKKKLKKKHKIWPSHGEIEFKDVFMRYRPELDCVLKGLSFVVKEGQRVGVIGRTGAGKSSLFMTLLRICEIETLEERKQRKIEEEEEKEKEKDGVDNTQAKDKIEKEKSVKQRRLLIPSDDSYIRIDGVDLRSVGLMELRSKVSVIPQDPVLFTGTLRFNLDPFGKHTDDEMNHALKLAHCYENLREVAVRMAKKKKKEEEKKKREEEKKENKKQEEKGKKKKNEKKEKKKKKKKINEEKGPLLQSGNDYVLKIDDQKEKEKEEDLDEEKDEFDENSVNLLDFECEENGSNFSMGQRQMICLARAIVRKCKVLLLDEATSAVDPKTDSLIQKTIREVFKDTTILTIAHRIETIMDYDRILIMENGKMLEYDSPLALMKNEKSIFVEIVENTFGVKVQDIIDSKMKNMASLS